MGAAAAAGSAQVGPQNASAVWILPAHDDTFLAASGIGSSAELWLLRPKARLGALLS